MKKKKHYYTRLYKLCRQEWSRNNPERKKAMDDVKFKLDGLDKWKCENCSQLFAKSEMDVDHIYAIGNSTPVTLEEFQECISKLHVESFLFDVLCKPCHKMKTKEEARERMRKNLMEAISYYVQPTSVLETLDTQILKKMSTAVKGMKNSAEKQRKRCEQKFDELAKKYL
jgi:5-methylcytosine-specific restriction endonuclease McrA